ncbi:hypothetical protein Tco_0291839 [Tanacetum coccineum]
MADLTFADSHNMMAYLEKSKANANFAKIVDFLNDSSIRYALTVSPTIYVSYIEQFWSTAKIKTVNNERQIRAKVDGKTIVISESSVRRDLQFNNEDDETVTKEREDRMERVATTTSSLEAKQDNGNINRTQSMSTLNAPSPQGTSLGSGPSDVKTASTPMETHKPLLKDADSEDLDEHLYTSMIRSLMYLTYSRLDIMFAVCACAQFHVNPKISHLHAVKRIFRYLKGQPKLCLWYPKDSPFDLMAFTDRDYAGASLDMKSTIGAARDEIEVKTGNSRVNAVGHYLVLLGKNIDEGSRQTTDPQHTSTTAQPSNEEPITVPSSSQPKKTHIPRKAKRATEISQSSGPISLVADETVTKEREDRIERAATTASSLEA